MIFIIAEFKNLCYNIKHKEIQINNRSQEGETMYAELTDNLLTGNKMIDGQHKELIDKINDLLKACENESPTIKATAAQMLNYLADYTEFHFGEEEKLQEEIGYPGIKEHKAKHEELRQVVADLHTMLEEQEGPTEAFVEQVNKNVIEWLYYHIQGFDRSVAEYKNLTKNENLI